jgi:exopolysaccharide biosynthesis polyprenyl glycosylphosphotransferase
VSALVVVDLAVFLVLRWAIRLARDAEVLGSGVAGGLRWLWPLGTFSGVKFVAALLVGLVVVGAYGPGDRRRDALRLFKASALAGALVFYPQVWAGDAAMVALRWGVLVGVFAAALSGARWALDLAVARVAPRVVPIRTILVTHGAADWVGVPELEAAAREGRSRLIPVGTVATGRARRDDALPLGELGRLIAERRADTVLVTGPVSDEDFLYVLDVVRLHGCQLLAASRTVRVAGLEPRAVWMGGRVLVSLTVPSLTGRDRIIKRAVDVLGAGVLLLLLSPLLGVIAVAIRLDSPGKALFSQERVGLGGRTFRMLKFRTMRDGADLEKARLAHLNYTGDPRLFKIPDDPRVTRVGRWLRRWSLDELPQLWNVLRGDMSLVGPRPFFEADLARYERRHFVRLSVKPGITGLWQVSGRSAVVDFEEVVRLDREYVSRWSLWLDLKILIQTMPAVLKRTGAY